MVESLPALLLHCDVVLVAEDRAPRRPRGARAVHRPLRGGGARRRPRRLPPRELARPRLRLPPAPCASRGWPSSTTGACITSSCTRPSSGATSRPTCARCGAPTASRAPSSPARWRARSGGDLLPALFPLNDRVLERSLAVVASTRGRHRRASPRRLPGRARACTCRHHLALPLDPLPTRAEARRALGLPAEALLVTAPGLATAAKGLRRRDARAGPAAARASRAPPGGGRRPGSPAAPRGMGGGGGPRRAPGHSPGGCPFPTSCASSAPPTWCSACASPRTARCRARWSAPSAWAGRCWSPRARPPPTSSRRAWSCRWIPVPHEEEELRGLLGHLLASPSLRETIGALARAHVREHHELDAVTGALAAFLADVRRRTGRAGRGGGGRRLAGEGLLSYFTEEVRCGRARARPRSPCPSASMRSSRACWGTAARPDR